MRRFSPASTVPPGTIGARTIMSKDKMLGLGERLRSNDRADFKETRRRATIPVRNKAARRDVHRVVEIHAFTSSGPSWALAALRCNCRAQTSCIKRCPLVLVFRHFGGDRLSRERRSFAIRDLLSRGRG